MKAWEIDVLKFCIKQWDELSNNPDHFDCITDHNHNEYHDAIDILERYDKILKNEDSIGYDYYDNNGDIDVITHKNVKYFDEKYCNYLLEKFAEVKK
jgi:hypothetical protein